MTRSHRCAGWFLFLGFQIPYNFIAYINVHERYMYLETIVDLITKSLVVKSVINEAGSYQMEFICHEDEI